MADAAGRPVFVEKPQELPAAFRTCVFRPSAVLPTWGGVKKVWKAPAQKLGKVAEKVNFFLHFQGRFVEKTIVPQRPDVV